jgi:hypothetical protein
MMCWDTSVLQDHAASIFSGPEGNFSVPLPVDLDSTVSHLILPASVSVHIHALLTSILKMEAV